MASARVGTSYATLAGRTMAPPVAWSGALGLAEVVLAWLERSRQRRHLAMLSDHMLKDIGLTRAEVEAETSKPFWRG